jgi:hypothetical protein
LILLEGAFLPIADAGMILGTKIAPAVAREDFLRKSLLDLSLSPFISPLF